MDGSWFNINCIHGGDILDDTWDIKYVTLVHGYPYHDSILNGDDGDIKVSSKHYPYHPVCT